MAAAAPVAERTAPRVLPWVMLGGAAGAGLCVALTLLALGRVGPAHVVDVPSLLGGLTLTGVLNVAGAFGLGLLRGRAARAERAGRPWDARVLPGLGTGFCGAFTSFTALAVPIAAPAVMMAGLASEPTGLWVLFLVPFIPAVVGVVVMTAVGTAAAAVGLRVGRGRS